MFLSAVYYFVGMSKLSEDERAGYVERFNNEDNLKLIKDFFEVFKEKTGNKYIAQIDEVIAAKNYTEMVPKFTALLSKIIENKDLDSLICYCDNPAGMLGSVVTRLRPIGQCSESARQPRKSRSSLHIWLQCHATA